MKAKMTMEQTRIVTGRAGGGLLLARLRSNDSALSAIEFGLLAPILFMLIIETVQIGLYFYTAAGLKDATSYAARQIMTGATLNAGLTANQFLTQILCPQLRASLSCANVVVNIQTVEEGASPGGFYTLLNANQTDVATPATMNNNQTRFCIGRPGSYVAVEVYYAMPVISPIWLASATNWNGSNVHFVSAVTAFKNEPFHTSNHPAC